MNIIKNKVFRIIATILGFFGISNTFTACYGVVPNWDYGLVEGEVVGDINGDGENEAVPGIQVSLIDENSGDVLSEEVTDADGFFRLQYDADVPGGKRFLELKDIDGEENGKFKNKKQETEVFSYYSIVLERDDSETPED